MADLLSLFAEGKYSQFLTTFSAGGVEESKELLTCKGIAQMRTGDVQSAGITFKQLLESNPGDTEILIYLAAVGNSLIHKALDEGNACLQSNDFSSAMNAYGQVNLEEYTGLNSDLVYQLLNNRAVCLLNSGRAEEALAVFESPSMDQSMSDETGSDNSKKRRIDVYFNTAIVLKTLGRYQDALHAFDNVLNEDSSHVTATCGKSEVLNHLGRHEEALEAAKIRIDAIKSTGEMTSNAAGLLVAMGFALMKLLRYEEAMQLLEEAVMLTAGEGETPVKVEAYRLRRLCRSMQANSLLSSGDNAGAISVFDEVIAETPVGQVPLSVVFNRSLAHMNIGSATSADPDTALGHLDEAIAGYDQVVQYDTTHFQGKVGLSQALLLKADVGAGGCPLFLLFLSSHCIIFLAAKWPDAQINEVLNKVVVALEGAYSLRNDDEHVSSSLAATYCRLKHFEKAAIVFRQMLQRSPDSPVAQQGLKACEDEIMRSAKPVAAPVAPKSMSPVVVQKKSAPAPAVTPAVSTSPPATVPATETLTAAPATGGDLLGEIRASRNYHSHDSLKTPGPFPVGVDQSRRELYLR